MMKHIFAKQMMVSVLDKKSPHKGGQLVQLQACSGGAITLYQMFLFLQRLF